MKRRILFGAAIAGISVMSSSIFTGTAGIAEASGKAGVYVVTDQKSLEEVKAKLQEMGIDLSDKIVWGQILSDCGLTQNPGQPETEAPETSEPETNAPETSEPETDAPETSQPETETPETNQPETDAPETSEPEADAPETNQPETNAPETSEPETDAPETSQPETETPADQSFVMEVVSLVNQERAKEGLPALQYDESIAQAALIRARETEVSFSHTRPDGTSFSTVLTENGISYRGCGENIAWGQKTPEQVMEGWMNSPGHRANIMNKNYTKIGVGYYQNERGVNYWTQLFTY